MNNSGFPLCSLQEVKSAEEELLDKLVKETRDILERYAYVCVCVCMCMCVCVLQSVLNASTMQRRRFQSIVASQPNLKLVHLQNWAGLGAVR